jgi:hypothetical protein
MLRYADMQVLTEKVKEVEERLVTRPLTRESPVLAAA